MITKTNIRQLFLYGIIGGGAAILDYGIFYLFQTKIQRVPPEAASIIGQAVGFLFSFFLNTFLNFKKSDKLFRRFLSYLSICLIGMAISTLIIFLLKSVINIFILKLACLVFVSLMQFVLNKLITYKF